MRPFEGLLERNATATAYGTCFDAIDCSDVAKACSCPRLHATRMGVLGLDWKSAIAQ